MNWLQKIAQTYYHGSPMSRAVEIESQGYLDSGSASISQEGTIDERGLIWVTDDPQLAWSHAVNKGKSGETTGKVFQVIVPSNLRIAKRHGKINKEQAKILDAVNKRPYDPIEPEITLSMAMYKLMQHPDAPQTYPEILPLLGYNAIKDESGLAIMANRLPVVVPGQDVRQA